MEIKSDNLNIYKNKIVLITGHTGFKGSWLSIWLNELGAKVVGFSLEKWENDYLFKKARLSKYIADERGDIADLKRLSDVFAKHKPEIVFHLAAQPLVRASYQDPIKTLNTNIMGTINVLECIRKSKSVRSGVMITSDKCYKNVERMKRYKETDELGGHDPYSVSKAAAELAIDSYKKSFFASSKQLVSSARAGNVIGGGDFAKDRLIPDCIKSLKNNLPITIRNPKATRPWQHVLEPLYGYLLLGAKLLKGKKEFAEAWNFGPERESAIPVSKLADLLIKSWGGGTWVDAHRMGDLHEAGYLSLDISKAKKKLGWYSGWGIGKAVEKTVGWYKEAGDGDAYLLCIQQIGEYMDGK